MNEPQDASTSETLDTFVTDKVRLAIGLIACLMFWLVGIALSNRLLREKGDEWIMIGGGIALSFFAGMMIRFLIHLMGMRILINADAVGFFRRGRMKFLTWAEIIRIRANSHGFITMTTPNEEFVFNIDVFKRGDELKRVLHRGTAANGVSWIGSLPKSSVPRPSNKRRPIVRLLAVIVIASAWLWSFCALPLFSDLSVFFIVKHLFIVVGVMIAIAWIMLSLMVPELFQRPFTKWWLSVLAAAFLGILVASTNWALAARAAMCEDELNAYVLTVKPDDWDFKDRNVGTFEVHQTREHDGGVYLCGRYWAGIVHLPDGVKPPHWVVLEGHLFGNWHRFKRHE